MTDLDIGRPLGMILTIKGAEIALGSLSNLQKTCSKKDVVKYPEFKIKKIKW